MSQGGVALSDGRRVLPDPILVGRNAGIDGVRRQSRERPLPPEAAFSDLTDAEAALVDRLDAADYRD